MLGMELGFERVDHLIALSALPKSVICKEYPIREKVLSLSFSNYVKSQVHLNVSSDLLERPLSEYVNALRFLKGSTQYCSYALRALNWFYFDMSRFLINNSQDVVLNLSVDADFSLPKHVYDLSAVKHEIEGLAKLSLAKDYDGLREALRVSKYASIIDQSKGCQDILDKPFSYAIAAILRNEVVDDVSNLAVLEFTGVNYED